MHAWAHTFVPGGTVKAGGTRRLNDFMWLGTACHVPRRGPLLLYIRATDKVDRSTRRNHLGPNGLLRPLSLLLGMLCTSRRGTIDVINRIVRILGAALKSDHAIWRRV